jgi:hypothetical protein
MTHDQSFPGPSNFSVNLRVQSSKLPPIMYSFVLLHAIHYILSIRNCHPSTKIFLCKFDINAAYRRCTFSGQTDFESLTIFDNILLVALYMTFEGSPCPAIWRIISERITDVGASLLQNDVWSHHELFDSFSTSLDPPFSRELSVSIPPNDKGKVDIYINDSIEIAPALDDIPNRVICAIPLAIWAISRPLSNSDVIPRKDIISLKKIECQRPAERT